MRKSSSSSGDFSSSGTGILFVFGTLSVNTKWWPLLENLNKCSKLLWTYFVRMRCMFKVLRFVHPGEPCGCKCTYRSVVVMVKGMDVYRGMNVEGMARKLCGINTLYKLPNFNN